MIELKDDRQIKQEAETAVDAVRADIVERYEAGDSRPWILGFSGGKDSTLLAQLVFEALLRVPPKRRTRDVYVLSSDTQVETPYVAEFVAETVKTMEAAATSLNVPVKTVIVTPELNDTFWVKVIGYGYPPPSRLMRWCTDRLKIKPANRFILEQISTHGEVMMLLGARYEESQERAQSLARHEVGGGLHRHTTMPKAFVWSPIRFLTLEQVWAYLVYNPPPWGGDNRVLRDLYKNANAGECPLVVDETTEPCGNSRFGCYVCTVVDRDKSLEGFVQAGDSRYEGMLGLRDHLIKLRDNHANRMTVRRNGEPGVGPLTMDARRDLLERILALQADLGEELISAEEVSTIRRIWITDTLDPN